MSSVQPRCSAGTSVLTPCRDESVAAVGVDPDHQRRVTHVAEPRALDVPAGIRSAGARHRYSVAVALEQRLES